MTITEVQATTTYFEQAGPGNTERTLDLVRRRAQALSLPTILVATTTGKTGALFAEAFESSGTQIVAVTHSTGFRGPDQQELTEENRSAIERAGGCILTCQHAFGGVARAVRKKLDTYQLDEIIAYTLRTFGQGIKVVVEMAMMAADAGLVRTDVPVMAVAGSGRGADTAAILLPANAQAFFDLQVVEIVCRPSTKHPGLG